MNREIPRELEARALTTSAVEAITGTVFVTPDPRLSELMVVFGASRASGNWWPAARLIGSGVAKRVLVTGGMPYEESGAITEAAAIRSELVKYGIPSRSIVVEERSRNTLENVMFCRERLLSTGGLPASILFYCKSHHSGRVCRTLAKHLPGTALFHAGYDATYEGVTVRQGDWHTSRAATARVLGEYERILRYSARGDVV